MLKVGDVVRRKREFWDDWFWVKSCESHSTSPFGNFVVNRVSHDVFGDSVGLVGFVSTFDLVRFELSPTNLTIEDCL